MKAGYKDNFFYILYFQEPGVAEAEFDADPRGILKRLYASPDTPRLPPELTDPKMSAGGWIPRLPEPTELPPWLSAEDLDYYVDTFSEAGFRGGISYYRNFHRNWETTPELDGVNVQVPVLFIAGEKDVVIRGQTYDTLNASMSKVAPGLKDVILYPETGHWVQQEKAELVNRDVLEFISAVGE